jgi:hypothetical protein
VRIRFAPDAVVVSVEPVGIVPNDAKARVGNIRAVKVRRRRLDAHVGVRCIAAGIALTVDIPVRRARLDDDAERDQPD